MRVLLLIVILLSGCGSTALYGDSISVLCEDFTPGMNRAVGGATSGDMVNEIEKYVLFDVRGGMTYHILIGANDIYWGLEDGTIRNIRKALNILQGNQIIITSILPTSWDDRNRRAKILNAGIKDLALEHGAVYRDRHSEFADAQGLLKVEYNADGIHLTDSGCKALFEGV